MKTLLVVLIVVGCHHLVADDSIVSPREVDCQHAFYNQPLEVQPYSGAILCAHTLKLQNPILPVDLQVLNLSVATCTFVENLLKGLHCRCKCRCKMKRVRTRGH